MHVCMCAYNHACMHLCGKITLITWLAHRKKKPDKDVSSVASRRGHRRDSEVDNDQKSADV